MRILFSLAALTFVVLFLSRCANSKGIQQDPDRFFENAYYTAWTGGVDGSGRGYDLFLSVDSNSEVSVDTVFFHGQRAVFRKKEARGDQFVASIRIPAEQQESPDIIMHADPRKEFGNRLPRALPEPIPFELEEGEAAVRVKLDGEAKYLKIRLRRRESSIELE